MSAVKIHSIEIVSATRLSKADFWDQSALGVSLRRLGPHSGLRQHISFENKHGLSQIYNERINAPTAADQLVFIHDDVWIDDYFFFERIAEGLTKADVIGVAGNKRRVALQPAWPFTDEKFTWDSAENLSGAVAHGKNPFGQVSRFGSVPATCELLDGVLLAANTAILQSAGVCFDPRFEFHFYDMDFCRSARAAGLRLSTWPLCITHQSGGSFGSRAWRNGLEKYRAKWEAATG